MLNVPDIRSQHVTLSQRVYEAILELLLSQAFEPGQRLHIEQIARHLGVSETPVKQGLVRLSAEGMVKFVTGKGPYLVNLAPRQVIDLINARMMCELYAVSSGWDRVTDEFIGRLEQIQDELTAMSLSSQAGNMAAYRQYVLKDKEFHCLIVSLSQNEVITAWYSNLNDHLRIDMGAPIPQWRVNPKTLHKHRLLINAFIARDRLEVELTIRANMEEVKDRYSRHLAEAYGV